MKTGIWAKSTWKSISGKDFACAICVCVERTKMYKLFKIGVIEPQSGNLMPYFTSVQLVTPEVQFVAIWYLL